MTYHDTQGREIEDLEMDKMREAPPCVGIACVACGEEALGLDTDAGEFCIACLGEDAEDALHYAPVEYVAWGNEQYCLD